MGLTYSVPTLSLPPYSGDNMSTYYNETLHDKTGSFLYEAIKGCDKLSEGACDDIRKLFADELELVQFIKANVDVTNQEAWELTDQVFPEPCVEAIKFINYEGEEQINAQAFM